MRTILLIIILAVPAVSQSMDVADWRTVYSGADARASVDVSSIEYRGDTPFFWLLLTDHGLGASFFISVELNCRTRRARIWRTVYGGGRVNGKRSGWISTQTARWDRAMTKYMCQ